MRRLNYESKDLGFSFALATAFMIVASLVLSAIFGVETSGWKFWLMQGLYTAVIGSSAFVYAAISKTDVFAATKLNKAPRVKHVVWGCVAVLFLVLCMSQLNALFLDCLERLGVDVPAVELEDNLAGLIICACIIPAFCEEIVFRGTVAQSLYDFNKVAAVCIGGALFALFHANPAQTLHQFVLGAFLTLLALRSGSLWTSVIVHLFNNLFVVALSYTPLDVEDFWNLQANDMWTLPVMIVGAIGFALCVFFYVRTTDSAWKTKNTTENTDAVTEGKQKTKITASSMVTLLIAVAVCAVLWISQLIPSAK